MMPRETRSIDDAEIKRIRSKYQDGMPLSELAKTHHVHKDFVRCLCRDLLRPHYKRLLRESPVGLTRWGT